MLASHTRTHTFLECCEEGDLSHFWCLLFLHVSCSWMSQFFKQIIILNRDNQSNHKILFLNDGFIYQRTQMQASPPLNGSKRIKFRLQNPDLNPIAMLWHDIWSAIHARKPANVADVKQFCIEEGTKILLWQGKRLMTSYQTVYLPILMGGSGGG